MTTLLSAYCRRWARALHSGPPYLYPGDSEVLQANAVSLRQFKTYRAFAESNQLGEASKPTFFADLIPIPYQGSLHTADIVLLQLNPGFGPHDYFAERTSAAYVRAQRRNLFQCLENTKFSFPTLDPRFAWHGGFVYWERRLRPYIQVLQSKEGLTTYQNALQAFSRRLAVLELVPYHSRNWFLPARVARGLPSVAAMKAIVHDEILPKAQKAETLVIVMRGHDLWGVKHKPNNNIFAKPGSFNRSAFARKGSPVDRALRRWLAT